jgi:hypothetical protein
LSSSREEPVFSDERGAEPLEHPSAMHEKIAKHIKTPSLLVRFILNSPFVQSRRTRSRESPPGPAEGPRVEFEATQVENVTVAVPNGMSDSERGKNVALEIAA